MNLGCLLPVIVLVFALVGIIAYLIFVYNGLVRLKNNITKSWGNIDVLLKQRHDEIAKLLKVCESQMEYEKDTLNQVVEARTKCIGAQTVSQKAQASDKLSSAVGDLFAVAENYPELMANQGFIQLQHRVSAIEESIADRREFYNESVNAFNISIQQIPDILIARMLGYTKQEMFKVLEQDKQDVDIVLNTGK